MRKFFIFFILFISLCSLNFISADYNGETPIDFEQYKIVAFLQDGNFVVPDYVNYVDVLIVGGGGSGGTCLGGGGGAGGLILEFNVSVSDLVNVEIGLGGKGGDYTDSPNSGGNSSFGDLIAVGGGHGGGCAILAANGGSGGGGKGYNTPVDIGGLNVSLQGHDGGSGTAAETHYAAGGGGGYSGDGGDASSSDDGGHGGPGYNVSTYFGITYGVNGYFATGGGGSSNGGSGGLVYDGGGAGAKGANNGLNATVNTGSGGGGVYSMGTKISGDGGSGIVLIRYTGETPQFTTELNNSTLNTLKLGVYWEDKNADNYQLVYANNISFDNNITNTYEDNTYTLLYLDNDSYWFNIRSYNDGNYSNWNNDLYGLYKLTKNDQLNFTAPSVSQSSGVVTFTWNSISDATSYDLQVSTVSNFSTLTYDTNTTSTTKNLTFDTDDTYYYRGRGKDNYYTGEWSDTLNFSLAISAIPFSFSTDFVNLYVDQSLTYYFTGMTPETEYTFNINKLNSDGTFNSLITTRTVNSDGAGEGDFGYTFAENADYPFSVTYPAGSAELKRHYVKPLPSNFHTSASHRTYVNPWNTGVGVGSVVYNNKSGQLMHDATKPTQSLYEQDEYIILNYQIPRPSVLNCSIIFKNIDTGVEVLEIDGRDLYGFNGGMGYGELNFIVIPLNGEVPDIVDANASLNYSYIGDDWHEVTFTKGAYYYYIDLGDDNYTYGESNLLIGNDTDEEWTLTKSASSYVDGKTATYTIAYKTEEIWDAYKYTLMYDASSQVYIIGTDMGEDVYGTQVFPTAFTTSTTRTNTVSDEYSDSGYTWIGFWPQAISTDDNTGYEYYLTTTYTITQPTDVTAGLDDFLDDIGLGTSVGKLILAMCILVGVLIALAMFGMPSIVLIIGALATALILTSIGLIPIWAIIILGIVLFLKAMSAFSGGGD